MLNQKKKRKAKNDCVYGNAQQEHKICTTVHVHTIQVVLIQFVQCICKSIERKLGSVSWPRFPRIFHHLPIRSRLVHGNQTFINIIDAVIVWNLFCSWDYSFIQLVRLYLRIIILFFFFLLFLHPAPSFLLTSPKQINRTNNIL